MPVQPENAFGVGEMYALRDSVSRVGHTYDPEPTRPSTTPRNPTVPLSHIRLASGRTAEVSEIRLRTTYGDMLEGYPFARLNDLNLSGLLHRAAQAFPGIPAHLVPPRRDLPDLPGGAFGPLETLPAVTCVALLTSVPVDPGLDPALHYSALTVAWLQDEPRIPNGDAADPSLLTLDWDALALDREL
ncbi:hypothetical protein ABZZ17_15645 [Streptomyces sp. NPDC006512]|uniref:hypothetical protein n=1 Tax=Streptomyces sp. NPDC006512 TaxID=3154307 RepID=UPI0033B9E3C1